MGYTTDFLGHFDVTPALNEAEIEFLTVFADSRRCARPGGPYEVPGNPRTEKLPVEVSNAFAAGQPGYWCDWQPSWSGRSLAYDGYEKFYEPYAWLEYLRDHFLRPGAVASTTGLACFDDFTFDHQLNGVVVANRRDTHEMSAIVATDNDLERIVIRPGVPERFIWGALPYEEEKDRWERRSRRAESERARRALDDVAVLVASQGT